MVHFVSSLHVLADSDNPCRGVAMLHNCTEKFRCALGKGGVSRDKREGDGATPLGRFPLRRAFYRPDRETPPPSPFDLRALTMQDGWCDDPASDDYNRLVRLPHPHRHERLWRADHVYDLLIVVGYNDAPVISGRGSAIFIHLARENYEPTEGCIAFARQDLLTILSRLTADASVEISAA